MKKLVFIALIAMISAGSTYVGAQETESVQTETKQLTKRELRKLKKQQEKEEKEAQKLLEQQNETKQEENIQEEVEIPTQEVEATEENQNTTDKQEEIAVQKHENNETVRQNTKEENAQEAVKQTPSRPFTAKEKTVIWLIVLSIIFLCITSYRYRRKCDGCKKWNAMKKVRQECIDEKPTTIVEKRTRKNSKGEVISTWEVDVPATIYYYRTHRKCKRCGYRDYLSSSKTRKN